MKAQYLSVVAMAALMAATSAQASVDISSGRTKHMNCTGGVCAPTDKAAVLNATDLANMLATSDVKVVTGSGAVTITVSTPFSWTSTHRLTLDANVSVSFRAPVEVTGQGAVTIVTNDGGSGGDLLFFPGGKLDFWDTGSSLTVNGKTFTLVPDLPTLSSDINVYRAGNLALAKDYDASVDGVYLNAPVARMFDGTFDALGHVIENLSISPSADNPTIKYIGLFSQLGRGGVIRDLGLLNVQIDIPASANIYVVGALVASIGNHKYGGGRVANSFVTGAINVGQAAYGAFYTIGGLAGSLGSRSTIVNSHSDCLITVATAGSSTPIAGGLAGYSQGMIVNSYASGTLQGDNIGGLVYENFGGSITNSYSMSAVELLGLGPDSRGAGLVVLNSGTIESSHATGSITQLNGYFENEAGGLVVTNHGSIENSYATGDVLVNGLGSTTGGLVAENDGSISRSFATGSTSALYNAGSLVGIDNGPITDSYARGALAGSGAGRKGGLIGYYTFSNVSTSYSTGLVTGNNSGGLIGESAWNGLSSDYWDIDTSQKRHSDGGTGLTDAQLKSGLPGGFDSAIWGQSPSINNGYPYLISNPPPQ
jgi:hypothetical protein